MCSISYGHVHVVYHTHKYSEITLCVIHVYTRLRTWKITVRVRTDICFLLFFVLLKPDLCRSVGNTGSGNLSTTHWIKGFLFFFSSLNDRLVQNAKGAVLAVENLSHEWKRCSVSLRLPQSPSRRRRHTGP